jgi:hypothetical protein
MSNPTPKLNPQTAAAAATHNMTATQNPQPSNPQSTTHNITATHKLTAAAATNDK